MRIDDSRLETLVYKALSTTERFYDLVVGDKLERQEADQQLCQTLLDMGLIERGTLNYLCHQCYILTQQQRRTTYG